MNGFAVSYSKTATDNLPILQVKLSVKKPCTNSSQTAKADIHYFTLEKDKDGKCDESLITKQFLDERYIQTAFRYDLGKLQEEMGVFDRLYRIPFGRPN